MASTFMQKFPKLVKYKVAGSYPGCVAVLREPGAGFIVYIPVPVTGNNLELNLFDNVTVSNSEVDEFSGGVTLRSAVDPVLVT